MTFYLKKKFLEEYQDRFQKILIKDCKELPIKNIAYDEQVIFVDKVNLITKKIAEYKSFQNSFTKFLLAKFGDLSINKKLETGKNYQVSVCLKSLKNRKLR